MALTVGTDSFISLTDADAYFGNRLRASTWTSASVADQEKGLRMATAMLCREPYVGMIASTTQTLAWPRQGVADAEGRGIGITVIPQAIADATCELAFRLLAEDLTADAPNRGVRSIAESIGPIKTATEYDGRAPARTLPDIVMALLRPFLRPADSASARLVF